MKIDEFRKSTEKAFGWDKTTKKEMSIAVGGCLLILGIYSFIFPGPPSSGRFGWLYSWLYEHIGIYGEAALFSAIGMAFIIFGISSRGE